MVTHDGGIKTEATYYEEKVQSETSNQTIGRNTLKQKQYITYHYLSYSYSYLLSGKLMT